MFRWLREFLEIVHESRQRKLELIQESNEKKCESCEILKVELQRVNIEKERLLNRLLEKPIDPPVNNPVDITPPRQIPWAVRKQMLQAEDREKARLMREAVKPDDSKIDVKDLERELNIVEQERNG